MKKATCTFLALGSASLSLALSIGWSLNRNTSGNWFEESGFLVNLGVTLLSITAAIAAFVRGEPKRHLAAYSLLLATPGALLCVRVLVAIAGFMIHGDT